MVAYVNTAGKEARDGKRGVQHAAGGVDELDILRTIGTQTTNSTENSDGAKRDEADEDDLRPWPVICVWSVSNKTSSVKTDALPGTYSGRRPLGWRRG